MPPLDFQHRTRLIAGTGAVDRLGELAVELSASRVLIVSDPGVVEAGHFARGRDAIAAAGLATAAFHDLHPNPTTDDVEAAVAVAKEFGPDLIVGLGGGSSMDCAKGLNFVYSCGGRMQDYWGVGKATADLLPMIAVPTTSGTGSEAQSFALISDAQTHVKMACGDRRALPAVAILDPSLTATMPQQLTALTGIDAVTHSLESFVTKRRNMMSTAYALQAWRLLQGGFAAAYANPQDFEARGMMQQGAYLAGMAIEASMLGAAHALANPLTARFAVPHGQAVGLMMPYVVRANARDPQIAAMYAELAASAASLNFCKSDDPSLAATRIADWLTAMLGMSGLATTLGELDVPREAVDDLADDAMPQWTLQHNPIALDRKQVRELYAAAFGEPSAS